MIRLIHVAICYVHNLQRVQKFWPFNLSVRYKTLESQSQTLPGVKRISLVFIFSIPSDFSSPISFDVRVANNHQPCIYLVPPSSPHSLYHLLLLLRY